MSNPVCLKIYFPSDKDRRAVFLPKGRCSIVHVTFKEVAFNETRSIIHVPIEQILSRVNLWVRVWLRAAQTERGNARGGATKKREISRTSLPINLQ